MFPVTRFGHEEHPKTLKSLKVHHLENVMTLVLDFRSMFDNLDIWFVATNEENKYKLEAARDYCLHGYPEHVTFRTSDPVELPVPSPTYLDFHAACAKVANLSGAAEFIDRLDRAIDDITTTLDPNGASTETLEHALYQALAY
ncbi:hypothetical protein BD410DRAFT_766854 [Rickenella mellea]|uniref:HNH nuclease domain-containing protein n=1 Tax=Rickenella mellea TaxID=50990 RepID=A0A4Y7QBG4_9AGAM|nr:hypothetical protein BD410DRAFT_766854 [Rickenella mellea]